MACRSAILIDNFLPQEKFDLISSKVSAAPNYTNGEFADLRDDLWKQTTLMVFQRLKEIGLYQEHFMAATEIPNFSVNQFPL